MTTTRQLAKLANIAEQTVRNYSRDYGELLSPEARGERGNRRFSDEDVQTFLSIVELRRADVPPAEVIARIRRGDIYINAPAHTTPHQPPTQEPQATPTPHQAPEMAQTGQNEALLPVLVLSSMEARLAAVERAVAGAEAQRVERTNVLVTGIVIGAAVMLLAVAVALALGG